MERAQRIVQIVSAISEEGPLSNADLADGLSGISRDQLRRVVIPDAESAGILEARRGGWDLPPAATAGKGGATHYVGVTRAAGCVIGLNVGRTYFAIGVADGNGRLFSTVRRPRGSKIKAKAEAAWDRYERGQIVTHKRGEGINGAVLLRHTAGRAREWLEKVRVEPEEIRGITISVPAPVSTTQSKLLTKSIEVSLGKVSHIASDFKRALGPGFSNLEKVVVANDADVAARGEIRYGGAHGKKDVVVVHAAYGIGAGIITEGSVLRNEAGGGVGELGHCVPRIVRDEGAQYGLVPITRNNPVFTCACQHVGHLEALAGGEAIVRRVKASPRIEPAPPPALAKKLADPKASVADLLDEILTAAFGDDPWEPGREAVLDAAHLIGGAVHTITHVIRPEAVYVCGKLREAGPDFLAEVEEGFEECGPLTLYEPEIALGTAADQFGRRHIMVRGAAMTAVRSTESLLGEDEVRERLEAARS